MPVLGKGCSVERSEAFPAATLARNLMLDAHFRRSGLHRRRTVDRVASRQQLLAAIESALGYRTKSRYSQGTEGDTKRNADNR